MQEEKYTYNGEKENAIFAVKLRGLFEDRNKTHRELAEYIENVTGESVTRQAIGQWCNGNTCPNLKTVPIIADFFGVSCDYLLTDTEIETPNAEITAICKYTGLSQYAAMTLKSDFALDKPYTPKRDAFSDFKKNQADVASRIIESRMFYEIVFEMSELVNKSEYITLAFDDLSPTDIVRLANKLSINPLTLSKLLLKREREYGKNASLSIFPVHSCANGDPSVLNLECDMHRYRLIGLFETISNTFDRRNWLNYSREELLEYLNITEEQLKELQAEAEQENE